MLLEEKYRVQCQAALLRAGRPVPHEAGCIPGGGGAGDADVGHSSQFTFDILSTSHPTNFTDIPTATSQPRICEV